MGKVLRIMNFGAFVEIAPGKEGMIHISKLRPQESGEGGGRIKHSAYYIGYIEIDKQGRINLSRKDALPKEENSGETG